jgi:hypothetical protein
MSLRPQDLGFASIADAKAEAERRRGGTPAPAPVEPQPDGVRAVTTYRHPDPRHREDDEQRECVRILRALGFIVYETSQKRRVKVTPGQPDVRAFHVGRALALDWETKYGENARISPEQADFLDIARRAGHPAGVGDRVALRAFLTTLGFAEVP